MAPLDAIAATLRETGWLEPATRVTHLTGVTLLFGTISVVDLRLLGLWRRMPVRRLSGRLLPWTAASFALIVPAGLVLFLTHAGELINSGVFALKMGLILAAGVNAGVFHAGAYRSAAAWDVGAMPPPAARLAGALSLALWLAVLACAFSLPEH